MFINLNDIKKRIEVIQDDLKRIEAFENKMPAGELFCARNGNHYKWFHKKADKYEYIPKKNKELAKKLAVKKYYGMKQKDLLSELVACEAYISKANVEDKAEKLLNHCEYAKLVENYMISQKHEIEEWAGAKYDRNTNYSENLNVKGTQGKYLRSKSEAIIDRILYNAGVPFHYEEKLELNHTYFYPDFTIKHPKTGKIFYWEHFGLMDNHDYINNACSKIRTYCENGIIPSVNLILTYETKEYPIRIDDVEELVKKYFL